MWNVWLGESYAARRLLILGESAYSWRDGDELIHPTLDHSLETARWMWECPQDLAGNRFGRMLTRALCGSKWPSKAAIETAWQSIAFTNYVPGTVGEGASPRPSAEQWIQAKQDWPEILDIARPRRVIVLGKTTWQKMPHTQVTISVNVQGYAVPDGLMAMCYAVNHPSRGQSWENLAQEIVAAESGDWDQHYFSHSSKAVGGHEHLD